MTCGFCGAEIDESKARHACASCPMKKKGCVRVKCPRCGYENPETPALFKRLAQWRRNRADKRDHDRKNA